MKLSKRLKKVFKKKLHRAAEWIVFLSWFFWNFALLMLAVWAVPLLVFFAAWLDKVTE